MILNKRANFFGDQTTGGAMTIKKNYISMVNNLKLQKMAFTALI